MISPVVKKSLDLRLWSKISRNALKWSLLHAAILGVLVYDVSNKCKYADSKLYWIEYLLIGIVACSLVYYIVRYIYYSVIWEPVVGTEDQKRLLQFENKDNSFVIRKKPSPGHGPSPSSLSCSFNDSLNLSGYSSPNQSQSMHINHSMSLSSNNAKQQATFSSPYMPANAGDQDFLLEPASLNHLLEDSLYQEYNAEEECATTMNNINTFWTHKIDDYAGLLKTSKYQLSPTTPTMDRKPPIIDDCGFYLAHPGAANKSFDVSLDNGRFSSAKLSHCVTNLKRWISGTVVARVASEISKIDGVFKAKGFGDLLIGHVGLERLKKTSENHLVTRNIPTLPLLIPFLELTPNQEYLVNRIKELSQGSCLAEFRHSISNSEPWDEHLPTDAAVIFHLFCTYVDMQLLPLPQPGGRPFYDRYVIMGDKRSHSELMAEIETKNKTKCAILVSNPLKPVFNFISAKKVNKSVPDRNNLYHVITQFIIYIKKDHGGYLENINLDKSGLNILCILDD